MIEGECRIEVKFLTDLQIDLAVILEPFNTDLGTLKVSQNRNMAIQFLGNRTNALGALTIVVKLSGALLASWVAAMFFAMTFQR